MYGPGVKLLALDPSQASSFKAIMGSPFPAHPQLQVKYLDR